MGLVAQVSFHIDSWPYVVADLTEVFMAKPKQVDIDDLTRPSQGVRFRSAYDRQFARVSGETATECAGPSLTRQEFKADADINTIVKRFGITGELPPVVRVPTYGDFTGVDDYRSALDAVMAAESAFLSLPSSLRARFDNDPQSLLEFVSDRANLEEAKALGLVDGATGVPTALSDPAPGAGRSDKPSGGGQ